MVVSPLDRMNYFKGILLLYQKKIDERDPLEEYIKKFVNILRFDPAFYEFTIRDIMSNLPAIDEPPHFLGKEMAKIFVKDCIKLAFEKKVVHSQELDWLHQVVRKNQLGDEWLATELLYFLKLKEVNTKNSLEIERYV
ncbi:MAG: hypothetical protein KAJ16_10315 [Calditrichia bacterium]|nr:hypothetical protein [Calditrichia bacterium]